MIDKFIFEKLDSISDEASNSDEGEIPIILICADRREKGEQILLKLFSIGVYSALLGNDRTIDNVCELINKPRTKKEAKVYYRIESDSADYKAERTEDVNEAEIQNIVSHFKKIGKNEEKCVESYNSIASQYTAEQLRIIVRFLPLPSRAILEEKCPKYQELMLGSVKGKIKSNEGAITAKDIKAKKPAYNINKIDLIESELKKSKLSKPVIIPSTVNTEKVRKVYKEEPSQEDEEPTIRKVQNTETILRNRENILEDNKSVESMVNNLIEAEPVKRGRGRPAKVKQVEELPEVQNVNERPNEQQEEVTQTVQPVKRGRGRPKKVQPVEERNTEIESQSEDINLFDLGNDNTEESDDFNNTVKTPEINHNNYYDNEDDIEDEENTTDDVLPGIFDNDDNGKTLETLPSLENDTNAIYETRYNQEQQRNSQNLYNMKDLNPVETNYKEANLANLLTADKKIVAFVGTSKNGTSFLVNNLAAMLSSKGINTAILDLTKNKNAYYIYTQNDERLRDISYNCIENLRRGIAKGIPVSKNLTVYTTLPTEENKFDDYGNILETLVKNHSLILLDCDFNTNYNYFKEAQEIYVVQTYDILTIQPLTAFLRELKDRNILDQNKLKIVINKALKVKDLTEKMIVGGISSYNDPTMSYMKELFDKDSAIYTTVPFEDQTYSKYLEGLMMCEISLNGYSKGLLDSLQKLSNMVYPLISSNRGQQYAQKNYNDYNRKNNTSQFGKNIDDTLNKMRRNF